MAEDREPKTLAAFSDVITFRQINGSRVADIARERLHWAWSHGMVFAVCFVLFFGMMLKEINRLTNFNILLAEELPHCCVAIHDVSVTVTSGIQLANEDNGSLVSVHKIDLIGWGNKPTRPLVHDPKEDFLYVSDIVQSNATIIYRINLLTGKQDKLAITDTSAPANMKGDILGIEHDYITNTLFWTNGHDGKVLKVELDHKSLQQIILHESNISKLITSGIALDECSQTLFWTSYRVRNPIGFIESSNFDGTNRKVLHQDNLHYPTDLTVDLAAKKLYWCDMQNGLSYAVERSNLDGSSREELVVEDGFRPISIALTAKYIYLINLNVDKLHRIDKDTRQEKLLDYQAKTPKSIGSRKSIKKCAVDTVITFEQFPTSERVKSSVEQSIDKNASNIYHTVGLCLNGGQPESSDPNARDQDIKCECPQNFYGQFCEKCDHCVNGKCSVDLDSSVRCSCNRGYNGSRCEHDVCFNYCLNGGSCSVGNQSEPTCNCGTAAGNYQGSRCQIDCNLFCQNNPKSGIYDGGKTVCSCDGVLYVASQENATRHLAYEKENNIEMQLWFGLVGVGGLCVIFLIAIICLVCSVIKLRKRPRIKKRIIVNKSITPTPLTSRPSPIGEQCEITIENCCNMNICETPCYEPQLRESGKSVSKTEEKKNLLADMEEGENASVSRDTLY